MLGLGTLEKKLVKINKLAAGQLYQLRPRLILLENHKGYYHSKHLKQLNTQHLTFLLCFSI